MKLLALGLNHKTAPLEIREKILFTPEIIPTALADLLQKKAVNEAVLLSTCNRTELYGVGADVEVMQHWLAEQHALNQPSLIPYIYAYSDQQAVQHLMRVASGLDSMVLGESQIFGQMKNAFTLAQQNGAVGDHLGRLFRNVFAVSKQVRTDTGVGANPITIAYAVVSIAKKIFAELNQCRVLLLGAGETIELVATHLHNQGIKRLIIANRSLDKANHLAEKFNAQAIGLSELNLHLKDVEVVITATHSQLPLLGKGAIESALKSRKRKPMLLIDLAVPRNIEPEVSELEDVYLYNLDDLQNLISDNLKSREQAAKQAESLIEIKAAHFMRELQSLEAVDTIRALRTKINKLSQAELQDAFNKLRQGKDAETVLQMLAHNLEQKILHIPTVQLRQAAYDGQLEFLILARRLFQLN
jgi:glutamyl-tRNA reductase